MKKFWWLILLGVITAVFSKKRRKKPRDNSGHLPQKTGARWESHIRDALLSATWPPVPLEQQRLADFLLGKLPLPLCQRCGEKVRCRQIKKGDDGQRWAIISCSPQCQQMTVKVRIKA